MNSIKTTIVVSLLFLWCVGLVFFGTKLAMAFLDRRSDQHTIKNLHDSITAYHEENRIYPGLPGPQSNDFDLQTDYFFMIHLSPPPESKSKIESPKRSSYFAGKTAVKDPKTGKWQSGLQLDTPETGGLFDKRGNLFRIRVDASGDGIVYSPINNQALSETFLIWSAGRDGKFETWADNARSWR